MAPATRSEVASRNGLPQLKEVRSKVASRKGLPQLKEIRVRLVRLKLEDICNLNASVPIFANMRSLSLRGRTIFFTNNKIEKEERRKHAQEMPPNRKKQLEAQVIFSVGQIFCEG